MQYCDRCFGPLDLVDPTPVAVRRPRWWHGASWAEDLWLKDETANPTGSFKDRVVAAAAARADELGAPVLACSSTGNLARALAVHAGRRAVVLVPAALPSPSGRRWWAREPPSWSSMATTTPPTGWPPRGPRSSATGAG